jgi:hypothetical protein
VTQSRFGEPVLSKVQLTVARGWLVAISNPLPVDVAVHATPGRRSRGKQRAVPEKYERVSR